MDEDKIENQDIHERIGIEPETCRLRDDSHTESCVIMLLI